jgi:hypothetical protein
MVDLSGSLLVCLPEGKYVSMVEGRYSYRLWLMGLINQVVCVVCCLLTIQYKLNIQTTRKIHGCFSLKRSTSNAVATDSCLCLSLYDKAPGPTCLLVYKPTQL